MLWVLIDKCVGFSVARKLARCVRSRGRRFRCIFFGGEGKSKRFRPNARWLPMDSDESIVEIARRLHGVSGGRVLVVTWDRGLIRRLGLEGIEALTPREAVEKLCMDHRSSGG